MSESSVETVSETAELRGMEPVSMMVKVAIVSRLKPRQRAK